MLIIPHTLSLITTHTCTAACDHCCFNCTPKVKDHIPLPRLPSLIDEALEIPSIRVIVFTGGECFLLGKNLDDLIKKANQSKLITRCVTNGYWGRSLDAARNRARALQLAGLNEINLSTGDKHAKFVNPEFVINAAIGCAEHDIYAVINIEMFKNCRLTHERFLSDERLIPFIEKGAVRVQRSNWIEGDGKDGLEHEERFSRFLPQNKNSCQTVLNVIAVTPSLNLVACCGLHLERIKDLHLGSVASASLKQVIANSPFDLLKLWIHLEGPESVLEWVKKHEPSYKLPLDSVHPCETCLHVYRDEEVKRVLKSTIHLKEAELVDKYMANLTVRINNELNGNTSMSDRIVIR